MKIKKKKIFFWGGVGVWVRGGGVGGWGVMVDGNREVKLV